MKKKLSLIFLFLIVSLFSCKSKNSAEDFRLETISHGRFYLKKHLESTVVLLFATTFCTPCKKEMLYIEKFNKQTGNKFVFATIISDPENIDVIKKFIQDNNISSPVLLDTSGIITSKYNVTDFPTTFIIDSDGSVLIKKTGFDNSVSKFLKSKLLQLMEM